MEEAGWGLGLRLPGVTSDSLELNPLQLAIVVG